MHSFVISTESEQTANFIFNTTYLVFTTVQLQMKSIYILISAKYSNCYRFVDSLADVSAGYDEGLQQ